MPIWLWLLLGGGAAFLIAKSGAAAASSAAMPALAVRAANGVTYQLPIDANLPADYQQQIQTFFATAGQTDGTVAAFAAQFAQRGFTVTAGSIPNVWAMIVAATGPLAQAPSSGGGGIGLHGIGSLGGSTQQAAPSTSPYASPSALGAIHLAAPNPPITFKAP